MKVFLFIPVASLVSMWHEVSQQHPVPPVLQDTCFSSTNHSLARTLFSQVPPREEDRIERQVCPASRPASSPVPCCSGAGLRSFVSCPSCCPARQEEHLSLHLYLSALHGKQGTGKRSEKTLRLVTGRHGATRPAPKSCLHHKRKHGEALMWVKG